MFGPVVCLDLELALVRGHQRVLRVQAVGRDGETVGARTNHSDGEWPTGATQHKTATTQKCWGSCALTSRRWPQ